MKYKVFFLLVLSIATLVLIYLGIKADMKPPIWTGIGFLAILGLF